ncbi:MBL fold metallo-hydrolase [Candidatus Shapirobacteria bacterium]|nr:MBL fold metallo-hydrolase [Candidatus Shapirobacteria bacterium]
MEIRLVKNKSILIKGKKESVVIDPTSDIFKELNSSVRIIAYSHDGSDHWQSESEGRVILTGPGEYEVGGVEIRGYSSTDGLTIYIVVMDGTTVGFVGGVKEMLTDKKIERIGGIDVLIYSMGKNNSLVAKDVVSLAKKMGANYLVPVDFEIKSDEYKKFMDETDSEGMEAVEVLKVDKDSLPDGLEVVSIWTK